MSDAIEYEGRILNIDPILVKEKLQGLGAKKIADHDFRRYVFDTIPVNPSRWVRLRSDGSKCTLTVKEVLSDKIDGTSEWEVTVSDIGVTLKILEKIGIKPRGYQENKREEYKLGGATVSIDYWPMLKPLLEIEGKNKEHVMKIGIRLGFLAEDIIGDGIKSLYAQNGIDLEGLPALRFKDKLA